MMVAASAEDRLAALRSEFDRGFAAAPSGAVAAGEGMLAIGVGGERFLVRLAEIAGLYVDRRIVPVPAANTALLGITGLRGVILPVFGLAALLGCPPADTGPRWLAVAARAPVALAFDRLDAHLEIARTTIVPRADTARAHGYVREAAMVAALTLSIIDLPAMTAAIAAHPL
ncbi:MAG TPA: chemotaxis protein CheW [Stellaceae bacterium]